MRDLVPLPAFYALTPSIRAADKVGVFNMFIGAAAVSGGLVFVWLAAGSPAGLICFALCYGFFSGAFISLTPGCFAALRCVPRACLRANV